MKKTLLSILSLSLTAGLLAQSTSNIIPNTSVDVAVKKTSVADGSENIGPVATQSSVRTLSSDVIGTTVYDLQTNGTAQRRIFNHSDGTISATWTMDNGATPYTNRGAGYNYFNGTAWGANPTTKVETTRNGWPAMASGSGTEIIVSHSGTGGLTLNKRSTKGTGAWTESIIPSFATPTGYDVLWPRAVVGGANDSTIHVISILRSSTTGGPDYKGLSSALVYYRSKDLGVTWDIQDSILPGLDSSVFTFVSADAYSIDANGDVIAFSTFNSWGDVLVYKSTNNGDSWARTIVSDFPINKYRIDDGSDFNNDGVIDTIRSCDGSGSIVVDQNNKVHVFYGIVRVLDADTTDDGTSYFPGTNGLDYWNEDFGPDSTQTITGMLDLNLDGTLNTVAGGTLPSYQVGLSSMPTAGVSASNTIYLAYSSMNETYDNGSQNYRHIYLMKSNDGGATWSDPENYTPDFAFDLYESVYPSMAKRVDGSVHIVYQRDFAPGHSISGDLDPASFNDIVYLKIDTVLAEPIASVNEISNDFSVNLFPNPTTDVLNVRISSASNKAEKINITLVDALGRTVSSFGENFNGNSGTFTMNVSSIENGVYFVRMESESGIVTKSFVKK